MIIRINYEFKSKSFLKAFCKLSLTTFCKSNIFYKMRKKSREASFV